MLRRRDVLKAAGSAAALSVVPLHYRADAASLVTREDISTFQQSTTKVAALDAAIKEMQDRSDRDPNDPKGWLRNARAHADYCAIGGADAKQVHFCWWFLSWHRAFISLTERKLREISGDASIAFPYWNWSSDRRIPASFSRSGSPLSRAERGIPPREVQDGEVDYFPRDPARRKLGVAALEAKTFEAKQASDIPFSFGGVQRPNSAGIYGNSRLEGVPHGPIHNYVGGDMADFVTAGRDPIFFAHHGNLDRLWEIWRQDPAKKATEPSLSHAFTHHSFPFEWLDGTVIMISAADTLDTTKLGYRYDSLEVFRPSVAMQVAQQDPLTLPPIATANVSVPPASIAAAAGDGQLSLVITGIETPSRPMTVGVYVKAASDSSVGPGTSVGTFAAVLNGGQVAFPSPDLAFEITSTLRTLQSDSVAVTLIPYSLSGDRPDSYPPLKYESIRIISNQ